jgi:hypothetical protein
LSAASNKNIKQKPVLKQKYLKGSGKLGSPKEPLPKFNIHNMKKWLYMDSTISRSSLNGTDTGYITASNIKELNGEIFKKKLDGGILQSGLPESQGVKGRLLKFFIGFYFGFYLGPF